MPLVVWLSGLTCSSENFTTKAGAYRDAAELGLATANWTDALRRLGDAICHRPYLFNMTKSRFSMDWFYPVMTGVVEGKAARQRLAQRWKTLLPGEPLWSKELGKLGTAGAVLLRLEQHLDSMVVELG